MSNKYECSMTQGIFQTSWWQ